MRSLSPRPASPKLPPYIGWALAISVALHLICLPFLGLKAQAHERTEREDPKPFTIDVMRVRPPSPPPPTPPPPTPTPPPPKQTLPPVRAANASIASHPRLHPPKLARRPSRDGEYIFVPQATAPDGNVHGGSKAQAATGVAMTDAPATPVATIAPPPATPKPSCANPNTEAAVRGQAAEPEYPAAARDAGATGTAVVRVTLDASGAVVDAAVERSSGFAALDRAALAAARASSYTPEIVDCVGTAGRYLFTVDFDGR